MLKEKSIFDDEIDLLDYIRVIIKRKTTILFFFTLSLLVINYLIYLSPQLYLASSTIHVGSIGRSLMTAQDAGNLLQKNRFSIVSSLRIQSLVSVTHFLSMYNSGKIIFKEEVNSESISISVKDKNGLRAIDISNAIIDMLEDEGNKIYLKERQIVNSQIQEYERGRITLNQQLTSFKGELFQEGSSSCAASLQELKNFYEQKYEVLQAKILELKEKLVRAQNFWSVARASYVKNYNKLSFDQTLAILGLGLILGVIFAFFQEFRSNNFK